MNQSSVPTSHLMAAVLSCFLASAPGGAAYAAQGDCGQPVSGGSGPVSTDCLFILNAAVGAAVCDPECICDLNGVPPVTSTDALICLNVAVGNPPPDFPNCPCDTTTTTSTTTTTTSTTTTTTTTATTTTTMGGSFACGDASAPACNGTCGSDEACLPGGEGCFCMKFSCGDYMGAPQCFGLCPDEQECIIDGNGCQCVPSAVLCEQAEQPQCNGDCPDDSFCTLNTQNGKCECSAVGCGDYAGPPVCLGVCPASSTCEDVDASCRCVPRS